jgi:hypothetical protein
MCITLSVCLSVSFCCSLYFKYYTIRTHCSCIFSSAHVHWLLACSAERRRLADANNRGPRPVLHSQRGPLPLIPPRPYCLHLRCCDLSRIRSRRRPSAIWPHSAWSTSGEWSPETSGSWRLGLWATSTPFSTASSISASLDEQVTPKVCGED